MIPNTRRIVIESKREILFILPNVYFIIMLDKVDDKHMLYNNEKYQISSCAGSL